MPLSWTAYIRQESPGAPVVQIDQGSDLVLNADQKSVTLNVTPENAALIADAGPDVSWVLWNETSSANPEAVLWGTLEVLPAAPPT